MRIASAVRRTCLVVIISLMISLMAAAPGLAQTADVAELPRVLLDTTYAPTSGATIAVAAGGDLQAALDAAQPGDVIELQAGATFTGNFSLPDKPGTGWIHVQSSALALLAPPGTRASPALAALMPKIVSPNSSAALTAAANAHHYRFIGVEITTTVADTATTNFALVALDSGSDFVFDRCYIHGTPTGNVKRGLQLNSARTAVIDSYLADFHSTVQDAQAIGGWNGPGPYKIVNNHLEASGENLLFGGADPLVVDLVPSDIEIRGNHFFKPLSWRVGDPSYAGIHWIVKNLLELKNAQRVLIDSNLFEHSWQDAQGGTAIVLTVRNQDGTAPWSVVQDVTFTNNIVRHTGSGIHMHGWDDLFPSQLTRRILIRNNLFDDISGARWGGAGWLFGAFKGIEDLVIEHNTGFQDGAIIFAEGGTHTRFVFRNNLVSHNAGGVTGAGTNVGLDTLTVYFPGSLFEGNVLVGGLLTLYPLGNFFPASLTDVGFVDLVGGDYRLAVSSPYKSGGTDGRDIGADIDAIEAITPPGPAQVTPPTFGVHYKTYIPGDFLPYTDGTWRDVSVSLDLPRGSTITELEFYYLDNDATFDIVKMELWRQRMDNGVFSPIVGRSSSGRSTSVRTLALSVPTVPETAVDPTFYKHLLFVDFGRLNNVNLQLVGARVGFTGPVGTLFFLASSDRFVDTRPGPQNRGGKSTPFISDGLAWDSFDFTVTGVPGRDGRIIPLGSTAVVGTVTALNPTPEGLFKILPGGTDCATGTSTVNFNPSETTANAFNVRLNASGQLRACFRGPGTVDLLVDVVGHYR